MALNVRADAQDGVQGPAATSKIWPTLQPVVPSLPPDLIHAELDFAASPLQGCFRNARATGEQRARRQLPQLLARLQSAGVAVGRVAP